MAENSHEHEHEDGYVDSSDDDDALRLRPKKSKGKKGKKVKKVKKHGRKKSELKRYKSSPVPSPKSPSLEATAVSSQSWLAKSEEARKLKSKKKERKAKKKGR